MANRMYNNSLEQLFTAGVDLGSGGADVRVLLLGGAGYVYTFDPDDVFVADLTPGTNELAGTGYGRITMTGETVTQNDTDDRVEWDATDTDFGTLNADNGDIDAVILFVHTGNDATATLIAFLDIINPALPFTTAGVNFTVQWNVAGIMHGTG